MYKKLFFGGIVLLVVAIIIGSLKLGLPSKVNAQEEGQPRFAEIEEYLLLNSEKPWLVGIQLEHVLLHSVDLSGANLMGSNFKRSEMAFAELEDSMIDDAQFEDTNLEGATFDRAIISNAYFNRADLSNTSWINAEVKMSDFTNANLGGGTFRKTDFSGSIFIDANFFGADLEGTNFTGAQISQTTVFTDSCFNRETLWPGSYGPIEALAAGAEFSSLCGDQEPSLPDSNQESSTNSLYLAFPNPQLFTEPSNALAAQLLNTLDSWSSTNQSPTFFFLTTRFPFVAAGRDSYDLRDSIQSSAQLETFMSNLQVDFNSYYSEFNLPEGSEILSMVIEALDSPRLPEFGGGCTIIVGNSSVIDNVFDQNTSHIELTSIELINMTPSTRENFISQFAEQYQPLAEYAFNHSIANVANCDCSPDECSSGCPGTLGGPGCLK